MRTRMEEHRSFVFERNIVLWDEGNLLGSNWKDDQYAFDFNVYWKMGGGDFTFKNWTFEEWKNRGMDQNSLIADPLFADPKNADFTLDPNSPALQLGFEPIDTSQIGPRAEYVR